MSRPLSSSPLRSSPHGRPTRSARLCSPRSELERVSRYEAVAETRSPVCVPKPRGRWKAIARVRRRPRHRLHFRRPGGCSSARQSTSFATKGSRVQIPSPPPASTDGTRLPGRRIHADAFPVGTRLGPGRSRSDATPVVELEQRDSSNRPPTAVELEEGALSPLMASNPSELSNPQRSPTIGTPGRSSAGRNPKTRP